MLAMLLAYDVANNVVATLDYCVARDENSEVVGLIDFEAHEQAGGPLLDIWHVSDAQGSGTWPEWLGAAAHGFKVERGSDGRISALIHKQSGHRRERAAVEDAIAQRIAAAGDKPADIRDIVGGPDRPLHLDDQGRTARRPPVQRPNLPIVGRKP